MEPENGSLFCLRGVALSKMKKIQMALEDLEIGCKVSVYIKQLVHI